MHWTTVITFGSDEELVTIFNFFEILKFEHDQMWSLDRFLRLPLKRSIFNFKSFSLPSLSTAKAVSE